MDSYIDINTFQLEESANATEYEPYRGQTYLPNSDGTVSGVTSLSPEMNVLTATDGVIIDVAYNRDLNKVIAKLEQSIMQ